MADSEVSRIGDKCGEGGGVGRPYLIVGRGRREDVVDDFGREATSAQNIGLFGVVGIVACEVIGEVDKVGGEAIGEGIATGVGVASGNAGEVGEVGNSAGVDVAGGEAIDEVIGVANSTGVGVAGGAYSLLKASFGFFACFSRTCS